MRKTLLVVGFVLGGLLCCIAQEALSSYKYVVVPTKFDAFRKENQHQTSTLVKYLLTQNGFNAVYENNLPPDLFDDRCLGLVADLIDVSSMLTTRAHISFLDCNGVEVYKTESATSKEKTFKEAFREAITKSFQSLSGYTYTYKPVEKESSIKVNMGDDVKTLDPDPKPAVNEEEKVVEVPVIPEPPETPENEINSEESPTAVIQDKEDVVEQIDPETIVSKDNSLWYAQEITNGFQLVDSSPQVRMRIYQTQKKGVFLAKGEQFEGIVYEDQGSWYFDYYKDGELVHQLLNIKF